MEWTNLPLLLTTLILIKKYSEDDNCKALDFLINYIFVFRTCVFNGLSSFQWVPNVHSFSPIYSKKKMMFFHYIIQNFIDYVDHINSIDYEIKYTTETKRSASYLDLNVEVVALVFFCFIWILNLNPGIRHFSTNARWTRHNPITFWWKPNFTSSIQIKLNNCFSLLNVEITPTN